MVANGRAAQRSAQVAGGGGGGVGGVVPALEGGDEHRPAQLGPVLPAHVVHRSTVAHRTRQASTCTDGVRLGRSIGLSAATRFSAPTHGPGSRPTFAAPTAAQEQGWDAIGRGEHTLILAPTGSGKTLAAFLWALDRLLAQPRPDREASGAACSTCRR